MTSEISLSNVESIWETLIQKGIENAMAGLTQMIQSKIVIESTAISKALAKDIPNILGGPETKVVGIYLTFAGVAKGHIMLIYDPNVALTFLQQMSIEVTDNIEFLDEMQQSALGEIGNIAGAFFLNAIANSLNVSLYPSPPVVLIDMAGAILDLALVEILQESDEVFIVESKFRTSNNINPGRFIIMPNKSFLDLPLISQK